MVSEILFDRKLLRLNQKRFAKDFANHNFLYVEVANRINENLEVLGKKFENTLKIEAGLAIINGQQAGLIDDENLNFEPNSFDLISSNLSFHFINQIPQFLIQVKNLLKPGGIFITSFFGEENLSELRHVLYEVENEIYGGISPRIAPTIDIKTAANLLQKAGFINPISDIETIEVIYLEPLKLLKDLKFMAQGNIMTKRSRKFATKIFLNKICEKYRELYSIENQGVKASFDIITVMGEK